MSRLALPKVVRRNSLGRPKIWFMLVMGFVCHVASLAAAQTQTVELTGTTMGPIRYTVKVVVPVDVEQTTLEELQRDVKATLARVNQSMSTYQEDSDVSRFNRSDSTDWQAVDAETARVVARAIEISDETDGQFDVTVGPIVDAWNFGPGKTAFKPPTEAQVESLLKRVGYQKLHVREQPPALKKDTIGLQIDLSAIAKGYAVDAVGDTIKSTGYRNYMVEVGGEVLARGNRNGGGPWRIGVERPDSRGAVAGLELANVVELRDIAIATSGDYRNVQEFEGQTYSHTIDPRTGRPVTHATATAAVVASDCMTADALATAVMVMGTDAGHKLCERMSAPLLTIDREGKSDKFVSRISDSFPLADDQSATNDRPDSGNDAATSHGDLAQLQRAPTSDGSIMPAFLGSLIVFALVIVAMAVGAILNNRPVTGSCGGLANMQDEDGNSVCGVCSKPTTDCTERVTS